MEGIRIRLDLTEIVTEQKEKFQWLYVDFKKYKIIQDISDYLKDKYDISQQLLLLLQEPFCLPPDQTIRLLQNGDLVKVKLEAIKGKKERKRSISPGPEKKSISPPLKVKKKLLAQKEEDDTSESSEEEKPLPQKRKRKRKRKNKNKNKIEPETDPILINEEIVTTPTNHVETLTRRKCASNHIFFYEEEVQETNLEKEVQKTNEKVKNAPIEKVNTPHIVEKVKNAPKEKAVKIPLEASSSNVTCEDLLLQSCNGDETFKIPAAICQKNGGDFPIINKKNGAHAPFPIINKKNGDDFNKKKDGEDFHALLSLAKKPIIKKRRDKDVYTNQSVVLTNDVVSEDFEDMIENLDRYEEMNRNPECGELVAFKKLEVGADYTPQQVLYVGRVLQCDDENVSILILRDGNEGLERSGKFDIDQVMEQVTLRNTTQQFRWDQLAEKRLLLK